MAFSVPDALTLLRRADAQDRFAHAYLITGPEGCGKRAFTADLCRLLVGESRDPMKHQDVHVLEPEMKSRRIGIDAVRELTRELQMRSFLGGRKVGVLFDADRLVEAASGAFLKTLEEPPPRSHLLLVTAQPEQMLDTILSRCIEIPLAATARRAPTPIETDLLAALRGFTRHERPALPEVFGLVREFQTLLAQAKEANADVTEAAWKREEPLYKQAGDKIALEDREAYYKALTESRYLAERSRLLAVIENWWADVLRQQHAQTALDIPAHTADTAALAVRFTTAELLRKAAALASLRENFGRNVQEQLAIECAFLAAFAA